MRSRLIKVSAFVLLLAKLLVVSSDAVAQDSPGSKNIARTESAPPLTAEKKALILELLKITEADKNVEKIVEQMMAVHQKQYPFIVANVVNADEQLGADQKKDLIGKLTQRQEQASKRMRELFMQKVNMSELMDQVAMKVYNRYYSDEELKDIIAFYKTPTGKKTLHVMPQLVQDSMDLTRQLITPALGQIIQQLMQEERAKVTPSAPAK